MAIPYRGNTGLGTYFITASTFQKQNLLQSERMAGLLLKVLFHYRDQKKYLLHEFVIMPNHFHLLLTPLDSLEKALQLIKGGFSYRAKKELGFTEELWQQSFYDHRVRNTEEYERCRHYIHQNPALRGLIEVAEAYGYSSASPGFMLDEVPQRLKPLGVVAS